MTSYSAMAARGRDEAASTTRAFHLRRPIDVRLTWVPSGPAGGPYDLPRWQVIGECGHVIYEWGATSDYTVPPDERGHRPVHPLGVTRDIQMGKRRRCRQCPRDTP